MKDIIIKNGTLVNAAETYAADIWIHGEKIYQIGRDFNVPDGEVIDASGRLIMPGGIDAHVHLDLPMFGTVSSDDHYSGTKAAAFGGTTMVIDFVPQDEERLSDAVDVWRRKADDKVAVDYGLHMNITRLDESIEAQIPELIEMGIPSVKVFMAYNGRLRLQDGEIFRVLRKAREYRMLTLLHAENGDVIDILTSEALAAGRKTPEWHALTRPGWGAVEATLRGAALAAQAQAPLYIVHMNMAGEVDQLEYTRRMGLPVLGETCLAHLFFTKDYLQKPDGAKWVCSPPLRQVKDTTRLWEGLTRNVIQVVSTDHCPFFADGTKPITYEGKPVVIPGKELGKDDFTKIPNGLPGVGDRLPILWTTGVGSGRITPNQFVALTSTNPAKIFGLYPNKGALLPGADADIVLWDPTRKVEYGIAHAQHRTDYNLYEGWELTGFPEKVFLRGQLIVDKKAWYGKPGMGRFIKRQTFREFPSL